MEGDLDKLRRMFDHNTAVRKKIEILKTLTPMLNSGDEGEPLLPSQSE